MLVLSTQIALVVHDAASSRRETYKASKAIDPIRREAALFKSKCQLCVSEESEHLFRVKNAFFFGILENASLSPTYTSASFYFTKDRMTIVVLWNVSGTFCYPKSIRLEKLVP